MCPRRGSTIMHIANMGHNWETSRGDSLVANRRQNKGLWCSAVLDGPAAHGVVLDANGRVQVRAIHAAAFHENVAHTSGNLASDGHAAMAVLHMGDVRQCEAQFRADLAVIAHAVRYYD